MVPRIYEVETIKIYLIIIIVVKYEKKISIYFYIVDIMYNIG